MRNSNSPIGQTYRTTTFVGHPAFLGRNQYGSQRCLFPALQYVSRHTPRIICASSLSSPTNDQSPNNSVTTTTEDAFAIDAGRDLFFSGLDEDKAIELLDVPLGELQAVEDRFIAAERLKFFPSSQSARSLMRFVRRFDAARLDSYILEDRIARRKAVESLGRHKGAFLIDEIVPFISELLEDTDGRLIEAAVWTLGEINATLDDDLLDRVMRILDNGDVEKRIVVQTLLRAKYIPAIPRLRKLTDSANVGVASASMTAVATLAGETDVMGPVIAFLRSNELNDRRSAIADITIARYVPALQQVAVCPNSLVLRARTVRVLMDVQNADLPSRSKPLDKHTAEVLDRLIWDHPGDLDLLGMKKETRKSRDVTRNIRQIYKNDALFSYLACRTLAEDHRDNAESGAAAAVLKSYEDLPYFDYFGAYHAYKTLGWLRYAPAYDLLLENAATLPMRFFNHKAGAVTALGELGNVDALPTIEKIAREATIWELKYACLVASERLGDDGKLRRLLQNDDDWLIRARCTCDVDFSHLRSSFPNDN